MSAQLPIIDRWEANGWEWQHVFYPTQSPFVIPAGGEVQIPSERFIFNYKEGVLIIENVVFDSPYCGIRLIWAPSFDTADKFTVANLTAGIAPTDPIIYTMLPPDSPYYVIRVPSPWKWEQTMQLRLINTDIEDHYCIAYAYIVAGTNKKPREPERLTAEKLMLYSQLYPEIVPDLKKKMRATAEGELEPLGLSIKT